MVVVIFVCSMRFTIILVVVYVLPRYFFHNSRILLLPSSRVPMMSSSFLFGSLVTLILASSSLNLARELGRFSILWGIGSTSLVPLSQRLP